MVVHDPNVMSFAINPSEDHPPLIVDTDRVKILQISFQFLQSVCRRHFQVFQPNRCANRFELAFCRTSYPLELPYELIPVNRAEQG